MVAHKTQDTEIVSKDTSGSAHYEVENNTVVISDLVIDKRFRGREMGYRFIESFARDIENQYSEIRIEIEPQSIDNLDSDNYLINHLADRVVDKSTIIIDLD